MINLITSALILTIALNGFVQGADLDTAAKAEIISNTSIDAYTSELNRVQSEAETHESFIGSMDSSAARDLYTINQMELLHDFYTNLSRFHNQKTLTEIMQLPIMQKSLANPIDVTMMYRFESFAELKQSFGPNINNELCIEQLELLNKRADALETLKTNSKDIDFFRFLDTYGRRLSTGLLIGNFVSLGMYKECLSLKIDSTTRESTSTRYCLAMTKMRGWSQDNQLNKILAFRTGVCLPKACDSLRYKNKYELIKRLMDIIEPTLLARDQTILASLYCLPDEDSPQRMWWKLPKTLLAIIVFSSWIVIIIFATIKYEFAKAKNKQLSDSLKSSSENTTVGLESSNISKMNQREQEVRSLLHDKSLTTHDIHSGFYKMLAITNSIQLLFSAKEKSLEMTNQHQSTERNLTMNERILLEAEKDPVVNLSCIMGIKAISMFFILMGHTFMNTSNSISNGKDMTLSTFTWTLGGLIPILLNDVFLGITGIVTCYSLFKQNQKQPFISSPIKWFGLFIAKYIRTMPIFIVIVYYCKYISKFTSSGPLWDYGTSSLAQRRGCEEESWLRIVLLGSNFDPKALQRCVLAGWYLANDFHFFMVTPFLIVILYKRPNFAQTLLKILIAASCIGKAVVFIKAGIPDWRPFIMLTPDSINMYTTLANSAYIQPQYRIASYLCGLLMGYKLYCYEQDKLKFRIMMTSKSKCEDSLMITKETDWPKWFIDHTFKLFILLLSPGLIILIGDYFGLFNQFYLGLTIAILVPYYHIASCLGLGLYILKFTTGYGNKYINNFLSSSSWRPQTKLGISILLINPEVIKYISQSRVHQVYMDSYEKVAILLLCISMSYLVAILIFILFEAPLNELIRRITSKSRRKQKVN